MSQIWWPNHAENEQSSFLHINAGGLIILLIKGPHLMGEIFQSTAKQANSQSRLVLWRVRMHPPLLQAACTFFSVNTYFEMHIWCESLCVHVYVLWEMMQMVHSRMSHPTFAHNITQSSDLWNLRKMDSRTYLLGIIISFSSSAFRAL